MPKVIKRYLIFMFDNFYPGGGTNDFIDSADTKEEIRNIINETFSNGNEGELVNIFDTKTGSIIENHNILDDGCNLSEEKLSKLLIEIEGE